MPILKLAHSQALLKVGDKIGAGGNAQIYKVVTNGLECAGKIFNNQENTKELSVMEHITELPGSHHFCIQTLGTICDANGEPVGYMMPLKNMGSLEFYVTVKPMDLPMVLKLCKQVLDALGFLHTHSMSHGDLKEANVLLVEYSDGEIKAVVSDISGVKLGRGSYLESTYPPNSLRYRQVNGYGCMQECVTYSQHLDHWGYALMIARFLGLIDAFHLTHDKSHKFIQESNHLANQLVRHWQKVDSLDPSTKDTVLTSVNTELKLNRQVQIKEIDSAGSLGMTVEITDDRLQVKSVKLGSTAALAGVKIGDTQDQLGRMVVRKPEGWITLCNHILSLGS